MNSAFRNLSFCVLVLLVLASLFDPGNLVFSLKMPTFIILVGLSLGRNLVTGSPITFSRNTLIYSFAFFAIPLLSVLRYLIVFQGQEPFEGFQKLNTFLFLFLLPVILRDRTDILMIMVACLTIEAFATISIFAVVSSVPLYKQILYLFGTANGIFTFAKRNYGSLSLESVYFHTSSLMIIPLAYYADCVIRLRRKLPSIFLWAVVFIAMFISGSRNNILFSIFTTYFVILAGSRRRGLVLFLGAVCIFISVTVFWAVLRDMLSSTDVSNSVKISYLEDYAREFKDIRTLLFGMGLGSFFYVDAWAGFASVTELTYLEIVRTYGLFFGLVIVFLLLYPMRSIFKPSHHSVQYLYIAYLMYLFISIFNPLFFSSSGILFLGCLVFASAKVEDARSRQWMSA